MGGGELADVGRKRPFGLGSGSGLDGNKWRATANLTRCYGRRGRDRDGSRNGERRNGSPAYAPMSDSAQERGEKEGKGHDEHPHHHAKLRGGEVVEEWWRNGGTACDAELRLKGGGG